MNITIHRGTNQIGGCVTEFEHEGHKVFIDFGEQLPGTTNNTSLSIEGLTQGDVSRSILFISHYHGDHIGKLCDTLPEIPVYMGATARRIYQYQEEKLTRIPDETAERHQNIVRRLRRCHTFTAPETVHFGSFSITPLMIDHSAFDAYMFVVEADGVRILHTGDYRKHGFRSKALPKLLHYYARNIDYIISEGTNINRPEAVNRSEQSLQQDFIKHFRRNRYNFILVSSTNIDRIFSIYHAARTSRRCFVCDEYQKRIMQIVSEAHGRYSNFYQLEEKTIYALKRNHVSAGSFFIPDKLKSMLDQRGFCMPVRHIPPFREFMQRYGSQDNKKVYLSMWRGYLDKKLPAFNESLYDFLSNCPYEYMHTSGHCDVPTMKEVFGIVKPRCGIIPIHTECPEAFDELFSNDVSSVIHLRDGETFQCTTL